MSPAELRRRILDEAHTVEDHQLLVLLWGKGGGSAADAITTRARALLDAAGGLDHWVEAASRESLRRQGVSEARAARLLAASEIARRTRTAGRPRLDAIALSALELVALTLDAISENPSSHEVRLCVDLIRSLQRTTLTLGAQPSPTQPLYQELLERLRKGEY